jgi:regulator of protease activity HflC (stomatin/prohibitin superfamily)
METPTLGLDLQSMKKWGITGVGLVIALLVMGSGCGFKIVDTGHRGVKTHFGKVEGDTLDEGLHFYNPMSSSIVEMSVREEKLERTTMAYTKDVQQLQVKYSVTFFPDKSKIHLLYQDLGLNWADKILPQTIEGGLKAVIGQYEAVDLIAHRGKAVEQAEAYIVAQFKNRAVNISKVELINLDFHKEFEKAVEAKVVAIQKAAEAKNRTVEVEENARQKMIGAKAEAESMRIRAEALSRNKGLVEYEAIQKWNGELPQYMMGSSTPFINLGAKKD